MCTGAISFSLWLVIDVDEIFAGLFNWLHKTLDIIQDQLTAEASRDFNFSRNKDDSLIVDKIRAQSDSIILCGMRGLNFKMTRLEAWNRIQKIS